VSQVGINTGWVVSMADIVEECLTSREFFVGEHFAEERSVDVAGCGIAEWFFEIHIVE
ncbi:hypothetical protein KI387_034836, partial [Taxus chinensis]